MKCLGNRTETGKARISFTASFCSRNEVENVNIFFSFQVLRALKVIAIDKKGSVKMA